MATSYYAFRRLPLDEQLVAIFTEGIFLMTRWEEEDAINLYWLNGSFFVEVYYHEASNHLHRVRPFTSYACLDDYACYVRLPAFE